MTRPVYGDEITAESLWAEYEALQLPPERRAAARRQLEERVEEARKAGVYERAREIAGTVKWSFAWQALRTED